MFKKISPMMMYFIGYMTLGFIVSAIIFSIDDTGDAVLNVIITLTNISAVGLIAIRSTWNYPLGVIGTVTYGYMAMKWGFNGDMMLNFGFYLPMQFIGWFWWSRKPKDEGASIKASRLGKIETLSYLVAMIICIILYGEFLSDIKRYLSIIASFESEGDWHQLFHYFQMHVTTPRLPYVDSTTTVLSIFGMIFMVKCKFEQWPIWLIVNIISTYMWGMTNLPTFSMWSLLLINSVVACILWYRNAIKDTKKEDEEDDKWDGSSNMVDLTK